MSDVLKGLRTYLIAQSSVTTLTGSRVYFGNLPQNVEYPSVVLHLITSDTQRHLTAASGLARSTVQIDCHAASYSAANDLAEAIRLVIEHQSGTWGTETVRRAYVTGQLDISETPIDGSQLFHKVRAVDVTIWHTQST